jgi:exosome complex component RRP43
MQAASSEVYQKLFPAEFFDSFVAKGLRPDGRKLEEARSVQEHCGVVRTANASCSARVGHTSAIAGITLELAKPSDVAPNCGTACINVRYCAASCEPA